MRSGIGPAPQLWFTYGPNTKDDAVIRALLRSGATGVRLTFSYGTAQLQIDRARQIRRIASEEDLTVVIVGDLQGEKCRINKIDSLDSIPVSTKNGAILTHGKANIDATPPLIPVQLARHLDILEPDDIIIEGDGSLALRVEEVRATGVFVRPTVNGTLRPGRGLMIQRRDFRPGALTAKDRQDLVALARSGKFDAVAVSFVSTAEDLTTAREILKSAECSCAVVAKIETALGLSNLRSIINEADAVMVARGDLALTTPWVDLYAHSTAIAQECQRRSIPWIIATQLVEGLERFNFPTRAECSDLAHWLMVGAHGAMLSYETAFGPRPVDSVACVRALIDRYSGHL